MFKIKHHEFEALLIKAFFESDENKDGLLNVTELVTFHKKFSEERIKNKNGCVVEFTDEEVHDWYEQLNKIEARIDGVSLADVQFLFVKTIF